MATAETTRRRMLAAMLALTAAASLAACGDSAPARNAAGEIAKATETRLLELRVGDCVSDLRESNADPDRGRNGVLKVQAVPCSKPHDAEVLRVAAIGDGDWPGYSIVNGEAARGRSELEPRLAKAGDGQRLSLLIFKPSQERWEFEDQHEVFYLVVYRQPRTGRFSLE